MRVSFPFLTIRVIWSSKKRRSGPEVRRINFAGSPTTAKVKPSPLTEHCVDSCLSLAPRLVPKHCYKRKIFILLTDRLLNLLTGKWKSLDTFVGDLYNYDFYNSLQQNLGC